MDLNLDLKDRKILYELDQNSRQSASQIAKKVALSTEVVNYRIKRLENENIITGYQTIINLSKLGIYQFKICMAFQHITTKKLEEIIIKLKELEETKWVVSCNGSWDMIISLETKTFEEIDYIKNKVLGLFEGHLDKKSIAILVEGTVHDRDYLLDKKYNNTKKNILMKKDEIVRIDELDYKILKILSVNSRKSLIEIASELKTTARVIQYRIQQLVKQKIILAFKISINYEKLKLRFYKAFIHIDNPKIERVKKLKASLEQNPNVIHIAKVLSNWEFEPEFEVSNEIEFDKIINQLKDDFYDIIQKIDVVTIKKQYKFVYF
ncbi:hypothetical protein C0585_05065 [Candidatus Woesearchaeota archaeon]|nr:MAG: hypothetical protein C0585_05065 [Candidatus Woesearchaeota archaeon]